MKNFSPSAMKALSSFSTAFLFTSTALLPLIVLPMGDNFLVDSKVAFLFIVAVVVGALWTSLTTLRKTLQITLSPFMLPLVALGATVIVSSALNQTTLPISQLMGFGGVYLSFVFIALIGPSLLNEKYGKYFLYAAAVPAILLSLSAGAELLNVGPSHVFNNLLKTQFPGSPLFSLAGSPLIAAQFLAMVVASIGVSVATLKKKASPLLVLTGIVALGGLAINVYTLYNTLKTSPLFLPYTASQSIALDVMKSPHGSVIGVGPENFLQTYLQLKPVWLNTTPFWSLQFSQGSNLIYTILVTLGLVGLGAWLFLVFLVVKKAKQSTPDGRAIATFVIAGLVLELFFPPSPLILGMQALGLLFWTVAEKGTLKDIQLHAFTVHITKSGSDVQKVPKHSNLMVYALAVVNAIIILVLGYWVGRYSLGQYYTFRANLASLQNNLLKTYEFQQKAINANKYLASYHRTYSLSNMAIGVVISNSKEATQAEKDQVLSLIEQSIREAKTATALEPINSLNWVNLARVYNNLIGSIEGAENLTFQAYSQASALSPNDPILSLELGGMLFRIKQYNQAVQVLEKTVSLKPDWANAYYNLANAYYQNKEVEKAIAAYQQTLTLLKDNYDDYTKVKSELEQIQQAAGAQGSGTQTQAAPKATTKPAATATPSSLIAPTATDSSLPAQAQDALKNADIAQ
jgi:tetratricopeptide (TPR) repeat protein